MYGLIAGFVEVGETLEEAVQREALEEVGLKLKNIQYMSSQPWPFPSNLMIAFRAEYESGEISLQEDEIADAQFFKFDQLPETFNVMSAVYHPDSTKIECLGKIKAIVGLAGPYHFDYKGDPLAEDAFDQGIIQAELFIKSSRLLNFTL